ncbi:MAG: hypothetical protein J6K17_09490 [Oscillospiraceae bacterium]|nr:hypothetical protein [Oscillospiraceae bacterium]
MNTIATVETAKGKLRYILFSTNSDGFTHYGITVNSTLFGDETATLSDISTDELFTKRLMLMLADNLVLPSTFKEVVEEYVSATMTV